MMVVRVDIEPTLSPGNPEVLFDAGAFLGPIVGPRVFDISPDGRRFLMVALGGTGATSADAQISSRTGTASCSSVYRLTDVPSGGDGSSVFRGCPSQDGFP